MTARLAWLLPLGLYTLLALRDPAVPGLYMDAVNPDYISAWLLRGDLIMPSWIYPDNYLAGEYRYPLLNSLYGGNIPAYLGMMLFQAIGFGLEQLRVFHAMLGGALLLSFYWALRQWRLPPWATLVPAVLLALDPNFVFAWRTQFYLQLVPAIFLFAAAGLLGRDFARRGEGKGSATSLWLAGLCLGFAAYCYFIYAFYAAAVVIVYVWTARSSSVLRVALPLAVGTLIGWLPYVYAHVSIILNLDFARYVQMLQGLQSTYGVIDSEQGGVLSRFDVVAARFARLFGGGGTQAQILGGYPGPALLTWLHAAVLLAGPLIGVAWLIFGRRAQRFSTAPAAHDRSMQALSMPAVLMHLGLGLLLSHIVLGLLVGKPLGLQHYISFVPLLYAVLGAALALIVPAATRGGMIAAAFRVPLRAVSIALAGALAVNVVASSLFMQRLSAHGGAGPYTDAINVAATELKRRNADEVLLFPQWGYWMGALTILGPRFHVFESPSLEQMAVRMSADPLLRDRRAFVLVLGKESVQGSADDVREKLAGFAQAAGLRIGDVVRCAGRNGGEPLWLVEARRV